MYAYRQLLRKSPGGKGLLCLLFVWVCFSTGFVAAADEPIGKAESVSGVVLVERAGRSETVKPGAPVFLRDKWQTKADSGVEIVFLDNSRIKMAAGTVLEITEYLYKPGEKTRQGFISMLAGKARFLVADLQDYKDKRFRVQAQTAVVGTRDTDFCVWIDKDGSTKILCLENVIMLFNVNFPDKSIILTANMISQVIGGNLPVAARFATPAERELFIREMERLGGDVLGGKSGGKGEGTSKTGGTSGDTAGGTGGSASTQSGVSGGSTTTMPTTTMPSTTTSTTSTTTSTTTTTTTTTSTTSTTTPRTTTLPSPPSPPTNGLSPTGRK